jgi:hypothetical protein
MRHHQKISKQHAFLLSLCVFFCLGHLLPYLFAQVSQLFLTLQPDSNRSSLGSHPFLIPTVACNFSSLLFPQLKWTREITFPFCFVGQKAEKNNN